VLILYTQPYHNLYIFLLYTTHVQLLYGSYLFEGGNTTRRRIVMHGNYALITRFRPVYHWSPRAELDGTAVHGAARADNTVAQHHMQHRANDQSESAYLDTVLDMGGLRWVARDSTARDNAMSLYTCNSRTLSGVWLAVTMRVVCTVQVCWFTSCTGSITAKRTTWRPIRCCCRRPKPARRLGAP